MATKDRNAQIAKSLADALAAQLYKTHCAWVAAVFSGGHGQLRFEDWCDLKVPDKKPYRDLAEKLIKEDHLAKLTKRA